MQCHVDHSDNLTVHMHKFKAGYRRTASIITSKRFITLFYLQFEHNSWRRGWVGNNYLASITQSQLCQTQLKILPCGLLNAGWSLQEIYWKIVSWSGLFCYLHIKCLILAPNCCSCSWRLHLIHCWGCQILQHFLQLGLSSELQLLRSPAARQAIRIALLFIHIRVDSIWKIRLTNQKGLDQAEHIPESLKTI